MQPSRLTVTAVIVILLTAAWFHHRPRAWQRVATLPPSADRVEVTAQGKLLYIGYLDGPRLVDPNGGPDIPLESAQFSSAQITSDGRFIYTLGDELRVWDAATGGLRATPPRWKWEPDDANRRKRPRSIDFDGKRLVELQDSGEVVLWDVNDLDHPRVAARNSGPVPGIVGRVSISGDARHVLVVDPDHHVTLLAVDTLKERWRQTTQAGEQITARIAPDARTLVVAAGRRAGRHRLRLINLDDLTERGGSYFWTLEFLIRFDPRTGNLLITRFSGEVDSLFDINTGKPLLPWPVRGRGLVLGEGVRAPFAVFDPFGGRERSRLPDYEQVVAFPDRRHVATWSRSSVDIWRGDPEASPDAPVLRQPRFWLLVVAGCVLPWSLCRSSAYHDRRRAVATILAAIGACALILSLAQVSLDHGIDPETWWRATLPINLTLGCLVLSHALARGGAGWLWVSRAVLVGSAAVAGWLAGATDLPVLYEFLDMTWRPPRWQLVALAFAWGAVVIACVAMLYDVESTPRSPDA
jgi:hypothetical protein